MEPPLGGSLTKFRLKFNTSITHNRSLQRNQKRKKIKDEEQLVRAGEFEMN